jgi:hypothetical protein
MHSANCSNPKCPVRVVSTVLSRRRSLSFFPLSRHAKRQASGTASWMRWPPAVTAVQMIDIDKLAANYLVLVKLAAIRIWLRAYSSATQCIAAPQRTRSRSLDRIRKYPDISVSTRTMTASHTLPTGEYVWKSRWTETPVGASGPPGLMRSWQ